METRTALTPLDLVRLPRPADGRHYELSKGVRILVGNAGSRHEWVKQRFLEFLIALTLSHPIGRVFAETLFALAEDTARIPDVAFVRNDKVEAMPDDDIPVPFAPDLAIEIISVSETAADAEAKVGEYLAAGVPEVWQVYPRERRVRVRTAAGPRDVEGNASLETPLLPGFSIPVQDFFRR